MPQAVHLSSEEKEEASKLYESHEDCSKIISLIINKYYSSEKDPITLCAIKKKIDNYLHNLSKKVEPLNLDILLEKISNYHEDIVWICYRNGCVLNGLFYTFRSNVKKGNFKIY
jgi:hypothetical protein